jgi:hypothetical protein
MSVRCEIKNYQAVKKHIEKMKTAPKKVIDRTLSDMRTRVPTWIAAEVSKVYGVKKAEVNSGKIGKMKVEGSTVKNIKIRYTGRVLTPTHFGMTPKAPGTNAYTLKASIIKGQKATLGKVKKLTKKQRAALAKNFTRSGTKSSDHSPIMLMHTGNAQAGGTNYIPFQRKSQKRNDVEAIKTLSLPQMVSSERTSANISKAINEGLEKRLDQHMKLLEK